MRLHEKKQTIGWKKEKKITCFQEIITLQKKGKSFHQA